MFTTEEIKKVLYSLTDEDQTKLGDLLKERETLRETLASAYGKREEKVTKEGILNIIDKEVFQFYIPLSQGINLPKEIKEKIDTFDELFWKSADLYNVNVSLKGKNKVDGDKFNFIENIDPNACLHFLSMVIELIIVIINNKNNK